MNSFFFPPQNIYYSLNGINSGDNYIKKKGRFNGWRGSEAMGIYILFFYSFFFLVSFFFARSFSTVKVYIDDHLFIHCHLLDLFHQSVGFAFVISGCRSIPLAFAFSLKHIGLGTYCKRAFCRKDI